MKRVEILGGGKERLGGGGVRIWGEEKGFCRGGGCK